MQIIAIGRMKDAALSQLYERYCKRMRPRPKLIEINAVKDRNQQSKMKEGDAILQHIPVKSFVIALDEHGKSYTSRDFASKIATWQGSFLTFVIGGADGLDKKVLDRADSVLSLGSLTWPHMLARIMLVEQLYRVQTILSGHPYHRQG